MVQRYRNQINEAATPAVFARNSVDGAATGVQVAGAIAGAGDELRRFAEVRKRQQDEWDAATVMNAQTEYARQMTEWMDDPETGKLQTLKLGAARGLTDETFRYADELAKKIAAGLENENQKAAFLRIAERAKLPYWKQASEHEARQMRAYKDQAFQASMEAGATAVQRSPGDPFVFESVRQQRENAVRAQLQGAAPEAISRAVEEANSDLEAARIAVVASQDPVAALAMTEGSPYLLPDTAAGLRKKLGAEVERLERQAADEAEKAAVYATTDALMDRFGTDEQAAWSAMENDPSLDPETRERIWGKYKARLSDRKRWEAQRDHDYMSGWMDKIADSSSLEEAQQLIQDSGADGRQRVQMERWAVQIHRPEKFKEDIRDWAQAFKEVTNGQIKTDEELIYRWGGRLSSGTLKSLVRIFYRERESGTGKKGADYVGYSFAESMKTAMRDLRIKEGSQESAVFTTIVGEEIYDRETQLKRRLSPLEKFKVLEEVAKRYVTNDGDILSEFQRRMAERRGFIDTDGQGFVRKNADGSYERYDPSQSYELPSLGEGEEPQEPARQPEPLAPLPERPSPEEKSPSAPRQKRQKRPKMMPDGTPYDPPAPSGGPSLQGGQKSGPSGGPSLQGGRKGSGRTPPVRGETPEMNVIIDEAASEFGVDPDLVRAVIKQESGWKPKAVSHAGAQGLMQLMPKTARGLGVTDSFDIRQNIRGGTKLLGQLLRSYNGDMEKALAAYNAGPPRANQDRSKWPKETKRYVPAVLSHYKNIKQGRG